MPAKTEILIFGQKFDQAGNPVPLTADRSMSSASTLSAQLNTTAMTRTSERSSSSLSTAPSPSTSPPQTTQLMTMPSSQAGSTTASTSTNLPPSSTSWMQSSSSLSGIGLPALIDVVYGSSYSVRQNGQTIGTFTISGGTGQYSSSNSNTLTIELDSDVFLEDGDIVTLFSVPLGELTQIENVVLAGDNPCLSAEGEEVYNEETNQNDYQLIISLESLSCNFGSKASRVSAIPALAGGGLI